LMQRYDYWQDQPGCLFFLKSFSSNGAVLASGFFYVHRPHVLVRRVFPFEKSIPCFVDTSSMVTLTSFSGREQRIKGRIRSILCKRSHGRIWIRPQFFALFLQTSALPMSILVAGCNSELSFSLPNDELFFPPHF